MLIAGNWKMFKGAVEAGDFCRALRDADLPEGVDVVVCPPFVSLAAATQALADTEIGVFAQNCHWEADGTFTGEISAGMLLELGVYGTLVGHSERRLYFGESDETVGKRVRAALDAGLHVIACVGETLEERETGKTEDVLRRQLSVLEPDDNLVIAYEPVWAIAHGALGDTGDGAASARDRPLGDRCPRALRRFGQARERGRAALAACRGRSAGRRCGAGCGLVWSDFPGSRRGLTWDSRTHGWWPRRGASRPGRA